MGTWCCVLSVRLGCGQVRVGCDVGGSCRVGECGKHLRVEERVGRVGCRIRRGSQHAPANLGQAARWQVVALSGSMSADTWLTSRELQESHQGPIAPHAL